MGIYLPIGMYPSFVQWIIKCFPISHGAVLLRKIMMEEVMERAFTGVPPEIAEEILKQLESHFGVTYYFGDTVISEGVSVLVLLVTGTVFMVLASINLSKKQK